MYYLSQSFFEIPKIVRLQFSHLILLKLSSNRDLNLISSDYSLRIDKNQLAVIYKDGIQSKFHFWKSLQINLISTGNFLIIGQIFIAPKHESFFLRVVLIWGLSEVFNGWIMYGMYDWKIFWLGSELPRTDGFIPTSWTQYVVVYYKTFHNTSMSLQCSDAFICV